MERMFMKSIAGSVQKNNIFNILLVSKFSSDPRAYTYASSFVRTLQELGFNVEIFNSKKNYVRWPAFHHDYLPAWLKPINNMIINFMLKRMVIKTKSDLIFCIKAENITYKTMRRIKQHATSKLMNFYPDNPFSFWNGNANRDVLLSLPLYDNFLIWSKTLIPILESAGCKKVLYFPFAYDEHLFNEPLVWLSGDQQKYQSDVCFIGTWDAEREWWLTELKKSSPGLNLALWGNGWRERLDAAHLLAGCLRGKAIYGDEMRKAFSASGVVLNFIRKQNLDAHNMRTFEVLASGAFLLTQRTTEQTQEPFKEGLNIACFGSLDELVKQVRYYLENSDERSALVANGQALAKAFTLKQKLQELLG